MPPMWYRPILLGCCAAGALASAEDLDYARDVHPIVETNCLECHGQRKQKGGVDLSAFRTQEDAEKDLDTWRMAAQLVAEGDMPPEDAGSQPSEEERARLVSWAKSLTYTGPRDPGRVVLRRLNRLEYNNTIRDLMGLTSTPADAFPSDEVGYGFDNIGDVLSLPPLLMEKYLSAANELLDEAIVYEQLEVEVPAIDLDVHVAGEKRPRPDDEDFRRHELDEAGTASVQLTFPVDGRYQIIVRAGAQQCGEEHALMGIKFDDAVVEEVKIAGVDRMRDYRVYVKRAEAGTHRIGAMFLNPGSGEYRGETLDRILKIESIEIRGPRTRRIPRSHRRIVFVKPDDDVTPAEAARRIAERFARRAYRRPVTEEEVDRLVAIFALADERGLPFEDGIKLMLSAVLISPHFLFRIEDGDPDTVEEVGGHRVYEIDDYELASRLSYFLWASMPDEILLGLAAKGELRDERVLRDQVRRMLEDRRSAGFTEGFAEQWLQLRSLETFQPDPEVFPEFDEILRRDMRNEAISFFEGVIADDRPILDFVDADYTWLNSRLASHYGITGVRGATFKKVGLRDGERGGVLSMAAILTITSNPNRTSPVKRGKFVLDQILGDPPPPPPPNVEDLAEEKLRAQGLSLREMLELHRDEPTCKSCHRRMDPIGFGLEHYDAIGRWRRKDGEHRIDARGELPNGDAFDGPEALKELFATERRDEFARCFTEKMLTYALGRGLESFDEPVVVDIVGKVAADDYRMSTLIAEVVLSYPFRHGRK